MYQHRSVVPTRVNVHLHTRVIDFDIIVRKGHNPADGEILAPAHGFERKTEIRIGRRQR
jgi:hypothetical protein